MRFYLFLILLGYTALQAQPTIPPPTQTDEIIIDNGATGKADPNDRIRYKVTIQNTGTTGANGTQLNIVPDPRTTFVPGTFRSSPLALPDSYACTGNVGITVPAASGLKANDFDDNIPGLTITAGTFPTSLGGSVMINADGSFVYTPPAGITGNDLFTYTLNDANGVGGGVPATDIGIVSITVSNLIWFIDNSSMAATSDGRLTSPFKTLAEFNTGTTSVGDLTYIEHTGTNYVGGIVLHDGERFFGEGHTGAANLSGVLPFTLAPFSLTLPNINGSRPIITNATGDGVLLGQNNILRGFDVGNCSDFGMDNNGANSVGNLVLSEVAINNTTGGGFDASHGSGSSLNAVFTSISSTGGVHGIDLTNCEGTFTVNGGTITNPSGTGVLISGGFVVFNSSGVITDNSGFAVDVDNHDSGNVSFSGNITSTGTGIRVQNCGGGTKTFSGASKNLTTSNNNAVSLLSNTGSTINISNGGLVISTTSGIGFNATGGALAINVTGTGNTISSGTGTALNVNATTIGASNLNFNSISANGSANGIVLNTTGSSGSLIVTGNGNTSVGGDNSGGIIQNTTGHGISLTNTLSPSFTNMFIHDTGGSGVSGTTVTNFTFNYGKVDNSGNSVGEANITFNNNGTNLGNNLTGTVSVINNQLTDAFDSGFEVQSSDGTISNLTITGNTITSPTSTATSKGSGIKIILIGTASTVSNLTKATISNNTISNFPSDAGIEVKGGNTAATGTGGMLGTPGNMTNLISITNNLISGQSSANKMGTDFIDIGLSGGNSASRSQGNFNISNNGTSASPMSNCAGIGIGFGNTGFATMTMTIDNNYLSLNNTVGSSGIGGGNGIVTSSAETPDLTITVTNNNITQSDGNGILVVARGVTSIARIGIRNNNVAAPLTGVRPGIRVDAGNASSVDDAVCVDISGNTSGGSGGHPGIGIRKQGTNSTVNDFGIEGFAGGTCAQAEDFIAALNPGSVLGTLSFCGGPKRVGGISGDNYVSCTGAP